MDVRARHRLAAVVDVQPYAFEFERVHVAETDVGLFEGGLPVYPAAQDAVVGAFAAILARRIELAVHLDAVPAPMLQAWLEQPFAAVLALHVRVVAIKADVSCVGAFLAVEDPARGPAVFAVYRPAAPARAAIGAAKARELPAKGGVLPVGIELEVVPEVHFLRFRASLFLEAVLHARAVVAVLENGD